MTGNQLERFARAHRQVSSADDAAAWVRRRLAWRLEDDGSLSGTFHLPPLQGAVLLKALRAAVGDLEHPHVSAETSVRGSLSSGAGGLLRLCAARALAWGVLATAWRGCALRARPSVGGLGCGHGE
jgi:hypothetical protein